MSKIAQSRATWVNDRGEIDPAFLAHGAKQTPRASTELIRPPTVAVPHLPWVVGDDDLILKMRQRRILAYDHEADVTE